VAAVAKPGNQIPQRVIDYRHAQWRKWLANALMADVPRNPKVLVALALSGRIGDVRAAEFGKLVARLTEGEAAGSVLLEEGLRQAEAIDGAVMQRIVQGVAASVAFGLDSHHLPLLLNYLEVDETRYFRWNGSFLDLFTMSELESLALDTGLAEALGARFRVARAGKKADFIKVLLAAKDFAYPVPAMMRYPRRPLADEVGGPAAEPVEEEDATGVQEADAADAVEEDEAA